MKKLILSLLFLFTFSNLLSQNNFKVIVEGLKVGDSATIILQKGAENLLKKYAKKIDDSSVELNFNIGNGKWALKTDATGYTFPTSKTITSPNDVTATITLTEIVNSNYSYTWQDDDSASGHATQSYSNEPTSIVVKDKTVKVPHDYAAIKLRNDFGVVLSNDVEVWSIEDSYRLYKMFSSLPYTPNGENSKVNFNTGEGVKGIFYLTNDEQYRDLTLDNSNGLVNATVSQSAFTYASPLLVTIDGIKGKFYSKRLYHVVVNYVTEFASNDDMVDWIARESFGFTFMKPNQETEDLMSEDSSNFQEFFDDEKLEILAMFEELPEGFHKQEGLKYMVRRINGQDHPKYKTAPAIAWAHLNTIEWMEKAFNTGNIAYLHRLILHEKAHFLWAYTFDDQTKDDWATLGEWYEDPTSASGWSTSNTTEFVSPYAHLKNPNEDMAESIAYYLTNPDALLSVSVKKYEFVRDRIMHGTRYVAMIREDLTFTVYNLFPDYTFPGKVTKLEIESVGEPEEDKVVTVTATLDSTDPSIDGASEIYMRWVSSIGTISDIRLNPVNGSVDSVLTGSTTFSKLSKSGYWTLAYFNVFDQVGNKRLENTSTLGAKLFINNPLEDIVGAQWNYDLKMELQEGKFNDQTYTGSTTQDDEGREMKVIKLSGSVYENRKLERAGFRIINPTLDDNNGQVYERQAWTTAIIDESRDMANEYESNKYLETYLPIPDYYPSGYYSISMMNFFDKAGNLTDTYFVKDTSDYNIASYDKLKQFKDVRDSIYVQTPYPDYIAPEIDVNNITIIAEPTNPEAPNGETRVDISVIARDLSDHEGQEAGIASVSLQLRDPQGKEFGYQTGNGTMNTPELDKTRNKYDSENANEWKLFDFNLLLPQGSAPGKWGISDINVMDKAGNFRSYNFVEYVRFDIIESDITLTNPLEVEIVEKAVNASNVDNITAKMSCSPCKDLNYVYTIYSRLGGGNVVRGTGVFSSDTIVVNNIKTTGVLDGLINLTVQVTDTEDQLIATKSAEYTKDVVYPKSYYSKSNLENDGTSSLDEFIIDIVVEQDDVGGTYSYGISNTSSSGSALEINNDIKTSVRNQANDVKYITGSLDSISSTLKNIDFSGLIDGYIKTSLKITDQVGNEGDEEVTYYFLENNTIRKLGNTINDGDGDGVGDLLDNCPETANEDQSDIDRDGIGDVCDDDIDGDSILNDDDNCITVYNTSQIDVNGNGVGDICDSNFTSPNAFNYNLNEIASENSFSDLISNYLLNSDYEEMFNQGYDIIDFDNDGKLDFASMFYETKREINKAGIGIFSFDIENGKISLELNNVIEIDGEPNANAPEIGYFDDNESYDVFIPTGNYHGDPGTEPSFYNGTGNRPDFIYYKDESGFVIDSLDYTYDNGKYANTSLQKPIQIDDDKSLEIAILSYPGTIDGKGGMAIYDFNSQTKRHELVNEIFSSEDYFNDIHNIDLNNDGFNDLISISKTIGDPSDIYKIHAYYGDTSSKINFNTKTYISEFKENKEWFIAENEEFTSVQDIDGRKVVFIQFANTDGSSAKFNAYDLSTSNSFNLTNYLFGNEFSEINFDGLGHYFEDIDNDGDKDLILEHTGSVENSNIIFIQNEGRFHPAEFNISELGENAPYVFIDLNQDNIFDIIELKANRFYISDSLFIDSDKDGIIDSEDQCPNTPLDVTVDVNGCEVFDLPLDNNKVSVTSASCIGTTDGSIGISVEDASYNYTVTVTGQDDPITLGGETKTASVTGLGTGTYTVCFKVDGQDAYEQCFEVNIAEPKALSAFIDVDNDNRTTSIQLSGSSSYNVEVNGQRYDVKGDRFTTNLPTGLSIIKISTDLDCQGVIEREIFISEDIHYYPNPTQTDVNVHVSGEDTMVQVSVFSEKGDLIYTREQQIQDFSRKTNIDLSRQITGTYIVVMDGPTVRKTFKIVKR